VLSIGLLIIKSNIPAVEFKDNYPIPENNQSHFLRDTNAIQNMVLPFPDREPSWTNRIQGEWIITGIPI
jgi:hypothetical protein